EGHHLGQQPVRAACRQCAEQGPDHEGQQYRHHYQQQGGGHTLQYQGHDRGVEVVRLPEIALHHVSEVDPELDQKRLVQPELRPELRPELLGHPAHGSRDGFHRVSRRYVYQQEIERDDREQQARCIPETLEKIANHESTSYLRYTSSSGDKGPQMVAGGLPTFFETTVW